MRLKTPKWLTLLTLLIWGVTFCASPASAHACCKGGTEHRMAPMAPCCEIQPLSEIHLKKSPVLTGFDGDAALSASVSPDAFSGGWVYNRQSLLALQYVPDQSDRHLRLCVLLN